MKGRMVEFVSQTDMHFMQTRTDPPTLTFHDIPQRRGLKVNEKNAFYDVYDATTEKKMVKIGKEVSGGRKSDGGLRVREKDTLRQKKQW